MNKTKWLTLAGSTIAVASSTALYINMFLFCIESEGTFVWANPWTNVFVFGANVDSILNDIGVALVCGVMKRMSLEGVSSKGASEWLSSKRRTMAAVVPAEPNSSSKALGGE
jgi:hypothetical protein